MHDPVIGRRRTLRSAVSGRRKQGSGGKGRKSKRTEESDQRGCFHMPGKVDIPRRAATRERLRGCYLGKDRGEEFPRLRVPTICSGSALSRPISDVARLRHSVTYRVRGRDNRGEIHALR